jgi:hypothetical protein
MIQGYGMIQGYEMLVSARNVEEEGEQDDGDQGQHEIRRQGAAASGRLLAEIDQSGEIGELDFAGMR